MKWLCALFVVIWCTGWYIDLRPLILEADPRWWQPLTYWLVHDGLLHLVANVGLVWMLAPELERRYGKKVLFWLVVGTNVLCGLVWVLLIGAKVVGASAAAVGLVFVYVLTFPYKKLWDRFPLRSLFLPAFIVQMVLAFFWPAQLMHLLGIIVMVCWMSYGNSPRTRVRLK